MTEISRSDVGSLQLPVAAEITDVEQLSSYNWIAASSPTIVVPGSPALWAPPSRNTRVKKDAGHYYTDQNAGRNPNYPLEPLFVALFTTQPAFNILSTDVVSDRSNLRRLLSFVDPSAVGDPLEPFTFEVEIHKNTALFSRVENANKTFIQSDQIWGFGHEFEKVYTRHQIEGSSGHYRIVSYSFGGMKFIVRHETDGYVGGSVESPWSGSGENESNKLDKALESLSLTSNRTPNHPNGTDSKLIVRQGGQTVPLSHTLEIKTRAIHRRLSIHEVAPQLWVSQTPKLVRAYHKRGAFDTTKVEDVKLDIERWQAENQPRLRKLAALIRRIIDIVQYRYDERATVRYIGNRDKLVVSPRGGKNMLPDDLYVKWEAIHVPPSAVQETPSVNTVRQPSRTDQGKPGLTVVVGKKTYKAIDLTVMPYFASYLKKQPSSSQSSSSMLKHASIPYFSEVFLGWPKGPRELFCLMPTQLSAYHDLCNTLEFLQVNVLQGRTIRHIMDDFRSGKNEWDPDEGGMLHVSKSAARDSAFRLIYMFLAETAGAPFLDKNAAYQAALFVVSHRGIFRYRTRKMVLEAFLNRYEVTDKQRASLDKWPIKDSSFDPGSSDDGETTEVSSNEGSWGYHDFDSDDSY